MSSSKKHCLWKLFFSWHIHVGAKLLKDQKQVRGVTQADYKMYVKGKKCNDL